MNTPQQPPPPAPAMPSLSAPFKAGRDPQKPPVELIDWLAKQFAKGDASRVELHLRTNAGAARLIDDFDPVQGANEVAVLTWSRALHYSEAVPGATHFGAVVSRVSGGGGEFPFSVPPMVRMDGSTTMHSADTVGTIGSTLQHLGTREALSGSLMLQLLETMMTMRTDDALIQKDNRRALFQIIDETRKTCQVLSESLERSNGKLTEQNEKLVSRFFDWVDTLEEASSHKNEQDLAIRRLDRQNNRKDKFVDEILLKKVLPVLMIKMGFGAIMGGGPPRGMGEGNGAPPAANGSSSGSAPTNGAANSNGAHANGSSNGHAHATNGHANGHSNGAAPAASSSSGGPFSRATLLAIANFVGGLEPDDVNRMASVLSGELHSKFIAMINAILSDGVDEPATTTEAPS